MATGKADVAKETLSDTEISSLCSKFKGVVLPLREHKVLFGGYSGTSIRVTGADGSKAVLKVCHGYVVADAMQQAAVAAHASTAGFTGVCSPKPLVDPRSSSPCVFARPDGTPVMMLDWVDGVAADKVLAAGEVDGDALLRSIGCGLAGLHSVPVLPEATARLRACEAGPGACDIAKHVGGELLAKMRASEHTKTHPYLTDFYEPECSALKEAMGAVGLPRGVLHGDPFLDNMLVHPTSASLSGFVDIEDICLGPLLFDIACCASACCFRPDGAFDIRRLRALLGGYAAVRPLLDAERTNFLAFMRLTMLCNCTWRFVNFNIDHREIESCREAHVELQDRIVSLHDDITVAAVEAVLKALPSAPTIEPPFFSAAVKRLPPARAPTSWAMPSPRRAALIGAFVAVIAVGWMVRRSHVAR